MLDLKSGWGLEFEIGVWAQNEGVHLALRRRHALLPLGLTDICEVSWHNRCERHHRPSRVRVQSGLRIQSELRMRV